MSGLLEVDCSGCGRRHVTNAEQARKERVLRCDCGHFVRLDRALADHASEPARPRVDTHRASEEHEHEEDDATHMLGSLAAVAAMSGRGRARSSPPPSGVDKERVLRPVQRASSLRSLSPAPARQPSIAPSDKPLWYVDLGGTDLVEMTIEQLILARRSGKLGEGALVWREGMPSWRPVGTLIPAAGASAHPAPLPAASITPDPSHPLAAFAVRPPMPGRPPAPKRTPPPHASPEEATAQSLASYERPLATLEFALERPEAEPDQVKLRSSLPSIAPAAMQVTRQRTPLPVSSPFPAPRSRPASLPPLGSFASPASPASTSQPSPSAHTPLSESSRPSPLPPPPPPPPAAVFPSPVPSSPAARGNERPRQRVLGHAQLAESWSERPRWVSVCIALLVCVSASAAGALLVRNLKQPRPSVVPTAPTAVERALDAAAPRSAPAEVPSAATAPRVVEVESLSVERTRPAPHYAAPLAKPTVVPAPAASDDEDPEPTNSAEPVPAEVRENSDASAPPRSNPYGSGSLIDQIKKATEDEESQ